MRRSIPTVVCIRQPYTRPIAAFLLILCLQTIDVAAARASTIPAMPSIVADLQSFRGRIAYSAHRADDPDAATVTGSLTVNGDGWVLEERSRQSLLHASNDQSWIRTSAQTVFVDDPFTVRALINSWAALLGSCTGARMTPSVAGSSWMTSDGLRIYLDSEASQVIGVADTRSLDGVSFAYADWTAVNGIRLPQSITRLRDGAQDASFVIDSYQVVLEPSNPQVTAQAYAATSQAASPTMVAPQPAQPAPWRPYFVLFAFFFAGFCLVVWTRRDAFTDRLCRRLAADPRGWRGEGTSVFVSPEGMLFFEGRPYFVGPAFYSQPTIVQSSPLFIRVSAKSVPRVVVKARKFPRPFAPRATLKRSVAGFTLVEALTSTALFTSVVVAVVFPALIILAQADRLAAEHQTANQMAANALVDEEAALEYGMTGINDATGIFTINGMQLTVTVSPSSIAGAHNVTVQVADDRDRILARAVTIVGPPVPPPGAATPPSPAP